MEQTTSNYGERAESASPNGSNARIGDILEALRGMLRRRALLLVATTVGLTAAALAVIVSLSPRYEATARIRIDPSRNPMAQDQSQGALSTEAIDTEISVMTSMELAREVVRRLGLDHDPEFAIPADQGVGNAERANRIARRVLAHVNIGRDKLSYVVALGIWTRDADKAAEIANGFADSYLDLRVRSQVGTSSRQAGFFRNRLGELAGQVNAADTRLADYRAHAGISENDQTGTITDQQIAPLSNQLATAEAEAAAARSNAATAKAQVARGGFDAVSEVRSSKVIEDLRRQRTEVVRNMAEISTKYGDSHPDTIRVREQLAGIDQQIREEADRVVTSLQAQAQAADAQVGSLRSTMRTLQGQRAQNTLASAQAERLEREAASARAAYDKMSQLSLESTQTSRGSIAQAEIIDRAQPPGSPSWPNRKLLAVLSFLLALTTALVAALALEMAQAGLRSTKDVTDRFGLPVLAAIPRLRQRRRGLLGKRERRLTANSVDASSATIFSESLRNLRASLFRVRQAKPPQVIAVTSALPNEGKTTISLALARMMAINGAKVLLIDCDLRNSELLATTGLSAQAGLAEVLDGEATLESTRLSDRVPGLDILPVSTALFISRDLFGDGRMLDLLKRSAEAYQTIVLDLPPALGLADARTLAALADKVAFVVRWGHTSPRAVGHALSLLETDNIDVTGVVFSMVDPSSEAAGGFYYSRAYKQYYRSA